MSLLIINFTFHDKRGTNHLCARCWPYVQRQ